MDIIIPHLILFYLGTIDGFLYIVRSQKMSWIRYILYNEKIDISMEKYQALTIGGILGNLDIVKLMIERGAPIDFQDRFVLKWSSKKGYINITEYLIEKDSNIPLDDYNYIFENMALHGKLDIMKRIIKKVDCKGLNGAFWAAIENGYIEIIEYLSECVLEQGYIIEDDPDFSFIAGQKGHIDIVKYLIKREWIDYDSAIDGAIQGGFIEIVKYLQDTFPENVDTISSLLIAIREGKLDMVKYLLARYLSNKTIEKTISERALLDSVKKGHIHIIEYLVEQGLILDECIMKKMVSYTVL